VPLGHKELQTLKGKSKKEMREMWRGEGDMEMGKGRGERGEMEREKEGEDDMEIDEELGKREVERKNWVLLQISHLSNLRKRRTQRNSKLWARGLALYWRYPPIGSDLQQQHNCAFEL